MTLDELRERAYILAQQVTGTLGVEGEQRHFSLLLDAVTRQILSEFQAVEVEAVAAEREALLVLVQEFTSGMVLTPHDAARVDTAERIAAAILARGEEGDE
jgi:hypothetical protein